MDTTLILILLPLLVVFSYLFDSFARKTKFPSVILLILTGLIARALLDAYGFTPWGALEEIIKVLGTVGLILIVLEGALELEITPERIGLLVRGFLAAAVLLIANVWLVSWILESFFELQHQAAVIHAIPLSIISSAVAIPAASGFSEKDKTFVVYESTFSDILGILIFNYAIRQFEAAAPLLGVSPLTTLGVQLIGIIAISVGITFVLFKLLQRIKHNVKFFLILSLLILVYAIGKYLHLPALVTIFIFGLILSNSDYLLPPFLRKNSPKEQLDKEIASFHMLTAESTFLVRTFFFLFFGFSISLSSLSTPSTYLFAALLVGAMLLLRFLYFSVSKLSVKPSALSYHAPRGLISILLFFQIKELKSTYFQSDFIDQNLLLLVILISIGLLLFGTLKPTQAVVPVEDTIEDDLDIEIPDFDTLERDEEDPKKLTP